MNSTLSASDGSKEGPWGANLERAFSRTRNAELL